LITLLKRDQTIEIYLTLEKTCKVGQDVDKGVQNHTAHDRGRVSGRSTLFGG